MMKNLLLIFFLLFTRFSFSASFSENFHISNIKMVEKNTCLIIEWDVENISPGSLSIPPQRVIPLKKKIVADYLARTKGDVFAGNPSKTLYTPSQHILKAGEKKHCRMDFCLISLNEGNDGIFPDDIKIENIESVDITLLE